MNFLDYFWRGKPDPGSHLPPPLIHAALLLIFIALLAATYRLAFDPQKQDRWIRFATIFLLADVVITNLWYWTAGYLVDPLPLYHCRIAEILLVVFGFWSSAAGKISKALRQYACSIGFFGALSAYIYPDPDPFNFPHVSQFSFYIGHALIAIMAIALLLRGRERWHFKDMIPLQILMLILNILIFLFDLGTSKNYAFLLVPPFAERLPQLIGTYPYALLMAVIYGLLMVVSFSLLMAIQRCFLKKRGSADAAERIGSR